MDCKSGPVFIRNLTLGLNEFKKNIHYRRFYSCLPKCFLGSFIIRTQNSTENFKPFWRLHFGIWSVVRPSSYGEELRFIQHSMSMVIDTRFHIWSICHFIAKCDRYYYKMQRLFYYKTWQNFLLQNATIITKWDVYQKLGQYTNVINETKISLKSNINQQQFKVIKTEAQSNETDPKKILLWPKFKNLVTWNINERM